MNKWNLKLDVPSAHRYCTAGVRGSFHTSRQQCPKANQTDTCSPPNEPLVLIVDDCEDDRILMSRALLRAGFRVAEATTGEEAVTVCQELQPQVVVLDLLMPRIGGLSACRLLRTQPKGRDLLILMLSGLQDAGTIRRAYDAGASYFLAKPNAGSTLEDYAALAERLRYLLRNQHLNAGNRID
jgi:CheY-like chemotaxis protein